MFFEIFFLTHLLRSFYLGAKRTKKLREDKTHLRSDSYPLSAAQFYFNFLLITKLSLRHLVVFSICLYECENGLWFASSQDGIVFFDRVSRVGNNCFNNSILRPTQCSSILVGCIHLLVHQYPTPHLLYTNLIPALTSSFLDQSLLD